MKLEELPTSEFDAWPEILPEPEAADWRMSIYSGTYSVHDAARVEDVTPERIARLDRLSVESPEGYASQDMCALVELTDGTWAAVMAWCDTTGWGCRSGVEWRWARTRADAISQGLDRQARARLGLPLPHETADTPGASS